MTPASSYAPGDVSDLLQAVAFAQNSFRRWRGEGLLTAEQLQVLDRYYDDLRARLQAHPSEGTDLELRPADVCWSCRRPLRRGAKGCGECGALTSTPEAHAVRYLACLCHEVRKHEKAGRLNLSAAHDCLGRANGRLVALRKKLEAERIPLVEAVPEPLPEVEPQPAPQPRPRPSRALTPPPAAPRRNLIEFLLDPRSIQWMLASGGGLLVLGLVIWLAAQGLFENKLVVAGLLGAANLALLFGGWAVLRLTRHETAGRALTLLACLVMPLNLWFYHAQGLITLDQGGHLWIPALVCCALYAVSARVVRDSAFVYVLVAGVAMTGLLLLADKDWQRFWEISAPATLLVGLGLLSLHAERLFPEGEGPFTRRRFGLAFFWSGHALLAAGLLLVLGAQLCGGWLYPLFEPLYHLAGFGQPEIVTTFTGQLLALGLVLAGTYAYAYSDLVVRRIGVYVPLAVLTLLWAEALLIHLYDGWPIPKIEVFILSLAVTGLVVNLLSARASAGSVLRRVGPPLALAVAILPVLLGVVLHFRATSALASLWRYRLEPSYVVVMLATALSCRAGAFLYRRDMPGLSLTYFFGTGAATLAAAAGLLLVLDPRMRWDTQAPLLMLIPLAYLLAARPYRGHTPERPLVWVAHAATLVMLLSSVGAAFKGFAPSAFGLVQGHGLNLALATFFAEAALFYGLAAAWQRQEGLVYLATAMACAAVWQVLKFYAVADEYYVLTFAAVGLALLVAYRFALLERLQGSGLARAAFGCANALLSLAFVAGALLTLAELVTESASKDVLLGMLFALIAASVLAVLLVRHGGWRRWYVASAVGLTALVVLVLAVLGHLTAGQKLEVVSVALGLLLLVTGHLGWYREQEDHSDLVSVALAFGSVLLTLPLAVAVLWCRLYDPSFGTFHTLNEMGALAAGLVLLASGFSFRIRSTTLAGAFLTAAYLVGLVLFLRLPQQLQTTAVYLMIGGGVFFGAGLVLSLYRDRLLHLPDRIKRREGVFRVLSWR